MPDSNLLPDPQSASGGQIRDRSVRPAGLLPKNTQTYVILAIALAMVGAIAFSGGTASKQTGNPAPKTATVMDPNLTRIQEYRNQIDEQARKLAAEQAQLEQTKQALGLPPANQTTIPGSGGAPVRVVSPPPANTPPPNRSEKSAVESEKEKREYDSLFASNVALTYRKEADSTARAGAAAVPQAAAAPQTPALALSPHPSLNAANLLPPKHQAEQADAAEAKSPEAAREPGASPVERRSIDPSPTEADGKAYRLFEGSILETVLTNRLEGSFDGPVNAMVTTGVYSHDGEHLLIPKGARILGEVKRNQDFGQQRLAVFFHRMIMPDGYSVNLDQFKGLSQIGQTGLRDQVNHHYARIFGVSLAIGAIAGLSNINTSYGLNASSTDAYREGVTANLSQSSLRILDKYLNVLPTFTIREGQRIKVILSDDLMLPAYGRHTMPGNF